MKSIYWISFVRPPTQAKSTFSANLICVSGHEGPCLPGSKGHVFELCSDADELTGRQWLFAVRD